MGPGVIEWPFRERRWFLSMAFFRFLVRELQQKREPTRGGVVWNGGSVPEKQVQKDKSYGLGFFICLNPGFTMGKRSIHSFYYCKRPLLTFTIHFCTVERELALRLKIENPLLQCLGRTKSQNYLVQAFFQMGALKPAPQNMGIWRFLPFYKRRYLTGDFFGKFIILFVPSCEGTWLAISGACLHF